MPTAGPIAISLQYLLVLVLAVVAPLLGWRNTRALMHYTSSRLRLALLRASVAQAWVLALLAIGLMLPGAPFRVPRAPGELPWLDVAPDSWPPLPLTATVACVLLLASLFAPGLHCALDAGARRRYQLAIRPYRFIAPVTAEERHWWLLVSVTAGVCEETLFRGFLLQFLRGQTGSGCSLGLGQAWLLSSLLFGLGHIYQGAGKALQTVAIGAALAFPAIATGSLLLPMLLHALIDLQLLWMYRPQRDEPDTAAALVAGCALD